MCIVSRPWCRHTNNVMNTFLKNPTSIEGLRCPVCNHIVFSTIPADIIITCAQCLKAYPIVEGIPIMIDDNKSIFRQSDFLTGKSLFFDLSRWGKLRGLISKILPTIVTSRTQAQFSYIEQLLCADTPTGRPRVLVLGGSILGRGMEKFTNNPQIDFVHSDVSFGPQTQMILDAHAIPYKDETFDLVIAQAVLEHVIDPHQCVYEIWRVLKPQGLIFAVTPFMQQVHGGAYDFSRFTLSGQRKLFNRFIELKSGASSGAGSVLAWSYQYLLLGLFGYTSMLRYFIKAFARITGFWMKYFDYLEIWNPYRTDGASAIFFIGKKSNIVLSDRDILAKYTSSMTVHI